MKHAPLFIAAKSKAEALAARLRHLHGDEWLAIYIDPETTEEWTRYALWDYHGPGPICFRRGSPTLVQALEAIERGDTDAEVAAATLYVVNELPAGKENLRSLVEHLEGLIKRDASAFARKVALAVAWSHADDAFNHRDPSGKSFDEVSADYEYFKSLAVRAASLRRAGEAVCGPISQDTAVFA